MGFNFLFIGGLLALPLAALPVVLHLLFRRKSPIVPFSTLRFIKSSIQHTAARKKVQRWMLLAVRCLLLALLIFAIAQPAKMLASSWFGGGTSVAAAVVVDTSYSMMLQKDQVTLLARANDTVVDLLGTQLKDAKVAIFRSQPNRPDDPEQLMKVSEIQGSWSDLKPTPNPQPFGDRVMAAMDLLRRQDADQKWLIIITDLQAREFPHPLPDLENTRVVLLDLHPEEARSVGVTKIDVEPPQPIPGLPIQAVVEVSGREINPPVTMNIENVAGESLWQSSPMMANPDTSARTEVRFPLKLPSEKWQLLKARLGVDDSMPWDNVRSQLLEIPPRQIVTLLEGPDAQASATAARYVRLAMDPSEGTSPNWPIDLRRNTTLSGDENVVVAMFNQWPDETAANRLQDFAKSGGTVILMCRPGLEDGWDQLSDTQRGALEAILPSRPLKIPMSGAFQALAGDLADPISKGLTDEKFELNSIVVKRLVPFSTGAAGVSVILNSAPTRPTPGERNQGLLYRKRVGSGTVYTLATQPESRFTNLATHPVFLPLLVRMGLRSPEQSLGQNVEVGQRISIRGPNIESMIGTELVDPAGRRFQLETQAFPFAWDESTKRLMYLDTVEPGLYRWYKSAGAVDPIAISNVQMPAAEGRLEYREAKTVIPEGPNVLIARSLEDLRTKVTQLSEPEAQWSGFIAVVLFLICIEALMGSLSKLWKANLPRFFSPTVPGTPGTP